MPPPGNAIGHTKFQKGDLYEVPTQAGDPPGHRRYNLQASLKPKYVPSSVKEWKKGNPFTWEDPDTEVKDKGTKYGEGNAYYRLDISKSKIAWRYESRTEGDPFVDVELTHVGTTAINNPPTPITSGNKITWADVTPGVDIFLILTLDKVEVRKLIKNSTAERKFTWQIKESDPLPLRRQKVSKGYDNADEAEPSREGTGPGRRKRQVELTHTETPLPGNPTGQKWYTLEEEWTGNTWALDPDRVKSLSTDVVYPVDIDVLVEEEIAADADDGFEEASPNTWNNSYAASNNSVIYENSGANNYFPGFRFVSVAIPQGATIDDATFAVERAGGSGTLNGTLHVSDEDNAAAWASTTNLPSTKTPAGSGGSITWNGTSGTDASTTGIATDIQTVINRGGWQSGYALALFDDTNTGGSGAYVYLEDEADADVGAARLDINYTAAGGGGSIINQIQGANLGADLFNGTLQ